MKTRYEESDNIVVRATRTVTDKMSELFGMLHSLLSHIPYSSSHRPDSNWTAAVGLVLFFWHRLTRVVSEKGP